MGVAMLCGAGVGLGVLALLRALVAPRRPLADALIALHPGPAPAPLPATDRGGWAARAGRPFARVLAAAGLPTAGIRRDLALLGRPAERHLAEKATATLVGLVLAPVVTFLLAAAGVQLPVTAPVWMTLLLAAASFLLPDLSIKTAATRRRRDARHGLSAFLDLVVIGLAGGSGVEGALADASSIGTGWTFAQLRHALHVARLERSSPWARLARLGADLDIAELKELAASIALAGTEGAKIRTSLAAKARALRAHELADAETAAQAATERMSLPVVVLFAGFLILIGYPAVAAVLSGL